MTRWYIWGKWLFHEVLENYYDTVTTPDLTSRRVWDSRWWGSLTMVPAGIKAKRLSSANHTTKTIHHHHYHLRHHQKHLLLVFLRNLQEKRRISVLTKSHIYVSLKVSKLEVTLRYLATDETGECLMFLFWLHKSVISQFKEPIFKPIAMT